MLATSLTTLTKILSGLVDFFGFKRLIILLIYTTVAGSTVLSLYLLKEYYL